VFGPASFFSMAGLATTRIGAFQMAPILTLWSLAAVVASTAIGVVVVAAGFLPCPVPSFPFFLQADLLGFFNMKAFVEIVQVGRVIRFGRADPVIPFFKVTKVRCETVKKSSGKHVVGHIIFN